MRILGYVRESTKKQMKYGYNKDDQAKKIKQFVEIYYPGEEVEILVEDGRTGRNLKRKQMLYLISEIKANRVDVVIFHNLDRFVRNVEDLIFLMKLFMSHNVEFKSVMEMFDINSPSGREYILSTGVRAQFESEHISSRTIRGVKEGIAQGYYTLSTVPYGFKRSKKDYRILVIDKKLVNEIKLLFKLCSDPNRSFKLIVDEINKKYKNRVWITNMVRKVIENPLYYGHMSYRGLEIDNFCPAIVTKEEFDAANNVSRRITRRVLVRRFFFKRLVYCAKCKEVMIHKSSQKDNAHYNYYYCPKCNKRINQDLIVKYNDDLFNKLAHDYFKNNNKYLRTIEKLEAEITSLKEKYKDESSDKNLIYDKIKALKKSIKLYKKRQDNQESKTFLEACSFAEKSAIVEKYVDKILVSFLKNTVRIKVITKG